MDIINLDFLKQQIQEKEQDVANYFSSIDCKKSIEETEVIFKASLYGFIPPPKGLFFPKCPICNLKLKSTTFRITLRPNQHIACSRRYHLSKWFCTCKYQFISEI